MKLTALALKKPLSTIMLMLATIILGVYGFLNLQTNMLPDITYPLVKVYVYWPGATPGQIENEIATVIERKMSTVDNLDYIESTSAEGVYTLLVNFDSNVDRNVAYQDVLAKMGLVKKELPQGILEPVIFKADPTQLPIIEILVSSENMTLTSLKSWVENEFQSKLTSVKGTAGTSISGANNREIHIHIDPFKLQTFNLSVSQVIERLKKENVDMVGGRMLTSTRDYTVRTNSEFKNLTEIENLLILKTVSNGQILLKDIAAVSDHHSIQRIRTKYNGQEGVRVSVFKQAEANAVEVSDLTAKRITELKAELPPSIKLDITYDQADYIRTAIAGVQDSLWQSGLLVILVTIIFLSGWKRVATLLLGTPVTLVGTFFLMDLMGFSINIFTLGGLVVAMTVVLDNSVVMLENITRIHETEPDNPGFVAKAAAQVSGGIFASSLTFIVIFLPFLLVSGLSSLLFRELVITISIIIFISMVVALTVTPMLMSLFYPAGSKVKQKHGLIEKGADKIISLILFFYKPLLKWSLKLRWLTFLLFFALLIPGYFLIQKTGAEFLPKADDGSITIKVVMPNGIPMSTTDKVLDKIETVVKEQKFISGYTTLAGGSVWGQVISENGFEGDLTIQLVDADKRPMDTDEYVETLKTKIMKTVKEPGANIKIFHTKMKGIKLTGNFDIELEVLAPSSESMQDVFKTANLIRSELKDLEFLSGLDISLNLNKPEYQVNVDKLKAFDLGISSEDIGVTVKTMIDGSIPTKFKDGAYYYPMRLTLDEERVKSSSDLSNIYIYSKSGAKVSLDAFTTITKTSGPAQIDRKDQDRLIKVTANVAGRSIGAATAAIQEKLAGFNLPDGYRISYGGQSQMLAENMQQMLIILLFSLFFGYIVMVIYFESLVKPLIITAMIPLSLAGIAAALYFTATPVSVTALIGIIMLTGMEINNSVMLITFIDELRSQNLSIREALKEAAILRLRPILITNINSVMGLLPLALALSAGTEMLKPMAIVMVGGILFGLLLVFVFIPVMYLIAFGRKEKLAEKLN